MRSEVYTYSSIVDAHSDDFLTVSELEFRRQEIESEWLVFVLTYSYPLDQTSQALDV